MMLGDPSLDMLGASHDTPALLRLTLLRTASMNLASGQHHR
jgi:hypothetical protein